MIPKYPFPPQQHNIKSLETNTLLPDNGYYCIRTLGTGTFGAVFEAKDRKGNIVAVKKVLQDPRYKNRELQILQLLKHPNCLRLLDSYSTREGGEKKDTYLHIVTEMFPKDFSYFIKENPNPPVSYVQIFAYQIFRGLAYIHSKGICHRDIKPTNVLVNYENGYLQLCDFGSAKPLNGTEDSVTYIATRNYRAPELLFDFKKYTFPIDVWAAGCVIAECYSNGRALFSAQSNEQMIPTIAHVIGSPTHEDIVSIRGNYKYIGQKFKKQDLADV